MEGFAAILATFYICVDEYLRDREKFIDDFGIYISMQNANNKPDKFLFQIDKL